MLDHGRFGRIVPVGDWKALGAAIEADLEANRARRAKWLKQFDPEVIAAQYVKLVRGVVSNASRPGTSLPQRQLHNVAVS
jgi:glycosyltransferase involved in cell wall biosynthesis